MSSKTILENRKFTVRKSTIGTSHFHIQINIFFFKKRWESTLQDSLKTKQKTIHIYVAASTWGSSGAPDNTGFPAVHRTNRLFGKIPISCAQMCLHIVLDSAHVRDLCTSVKMHVLLQDLGCSYFCVCVVGLRKLCYAHTHLARICSRRALHLSNACDANLQHMMATSCTHVPHTLQYVCVCKLWCCRGGKYVLYCPLTILVAHMCSISEPFFEQYPNWDEGP